MARRLMYTHPVDGYRGKGMSSSLVTKPHYCMPGLSMYSLNTVDRSNQAIQLYSAPEHFGLPVPFVPCSEIESSTNVVLDLVNSKIRWKNEYENLLKTCQEKLKPNTLDDIKSKLKKKTLPLCLTVPFGLSRFTSHLSKEPDQYFDSEYNWYFRNTIETFQFNEKWYLACARGVNLDILDIVSISNDNFGTIVIKEDKLFDGPIFDIKSSNLNELIIRQKTKLVIFSNSFDTGTLLNNNSVHDNCGIPIADFDTLNNNICTADVKHVIKILKDRNCIQDKNFEVEYDQTDSFMHLSYLKNQAESIAIINRQKFYLIDTRINISKPCSTYDPNTIIDSCEELTALRNSCLNSHSFYVASNHSVLTLDNRMGFVHKSYHMLSNPPSLITTHCYENSFEPNEMLFLGNQIGEGLVKLSYSSLEDDFLVGQNMVSSVLKPLDTLRNVRSQGHCLNPMLLDRFSRCLIGATAIGENIDDFKLFTINSAGDLFVQKLNCSTPIDVTKVKEMVTTQPSTIPKLNYSNIFNMSKLLEIDPPDKCKKICKKNRFWSVSKEKMTSYVDHLAPLILSPWDIDDLSEWESDDDDDDENDDAVDDNSDCDYTTKVHYWFNKNDSILASAEPIVPNVSELSPNCVSSQTTTKVPPTSDDDEDSSSGYTVSLKSDEN